MANEEIVVQIVVGTPDEIRSGRGETAVTSTEAGARLGVSATRVSQLVRDGAVRPITYFQNIALFLEREIEALKQERARARGL